MSEEQPISALKHVQGIIINEARLNVKEDILRWKNHTLTELMQRKYTEIDLSDAVQRIYMACIDDIGQEIKVLTKSDDSEGDGSEN